MPNAPPAKWAIERFEKSKHDRSAFECGVAVLNDYLKQRATQDVRSGAAVLYVAVAAEDRVRPQRIAGFYTIASGAVRLTDIALGEQKKLPRYPHVPVAHLGRMAVDTSCPGSGLGKRLLVHCLYRVRQAAAIMACAGVEVYAKTEAARAFYMKFGFLPLEDDLRHLYLPIGVVNSLPPEQE